MTKLIDNLQSPCLTYLGSWQIYRPLQTAAATGEIFHGGSIFFC